MANKRRAVSRENRGSTSHHLLWTHYLCGFGLGMMVMWTWMASNRTNVESSSTLQQQQQQQLSSTSTSSSSAGWHPIHVYYGDQESGLHIQNDETRFSQVHQDQVVLDLILDDNNDNKAGGSYYFVDLAANDAKEFSNTLALERAGWNGLCIEPNPAYWYGLSHRKCQVAGALVGSTATTSSTSKEKVQVKFRGVYGGIVGKLDEQLANRKRQPQSPVEERFTVPLLHLLQKFHVPNTIDYLSLDVEGAEYFIMKDFPFDDYTIRILTVERPSPELKTLLEHHDYIFLKDLAWWGETLWAHKSTGYTPTHSKIVTIPTEERN